MKPLHTLSDDEFAEVARTARGLPDAPERLLRAAIGLWPTALDAKPTRLHAAIAEAVAAGLRVLQAALTFDSAAVPLAATGMRSIGASTRQLLFSVGDSDVDLRISKGAAGYRLSGQVLGPAEGGLVRLHSAASDDAQPPAVSIIDAMGEFSFDNVPAGSAVMTLRQGDTVFEFAPIEIGERST